MSFMLCLSIFLIFVFGFSIKLTSFLIGPVPSTKKQKLTTSTDILSNIFWYSVFHEKNILVSKISNMIFLEQIQKLNLFDKSYYEISNTLRDRN